MTLCESLEGRIAVGRLVVHDHLVLDEVEAVADGLEGTLDHFLLQLGAEVGEVVHGLQGVGGVGDAEGHLELVVLDQLALEVVLLQHQELLHRLRPHLELQRGPYRRQLEELRPEVVLHVASGVGRFLADLALRFLDLKEHLVLVGIPDPEEDELDVEDVVFWVAEVVAGGLGQGPHLLDRRLVLHCDKSKLFQSPALQQSLQVQGLLPQLAQLVVLRLEQALHASADLSNPPLGFPQLLLKVLPQLFVLLQQPLLSGDRIVTAGLLVGTKLVALLPQLIDPGLHSVQLGLEPCIGGLQFVEQGSGHLKIAPHPVRLPLQNNLLVLELLLVQPDLLCLPEQLSPLPLQQLMLIQYGFILALHLPSDGLVTRSVPPAFQHQHLVFELVVLEGECLLRLPELVQLLAVLVGRLLQEGDLPRELPLPGHTLSHLPLHLGCLPLRVISLGLGLPEDGGVLLVLLLDGLEVGHEDGVLSEEEVVLLVQLACLLGLVPRNGLDDLGDVIVLAPDDLLELVVLCEDLLADADGVGELPLDEGHLPAEEQVLLLEGVEDGPELAVGGEDAVEGGDLVVHDGVAVGRLVLRELLLELVDHPREGVVGAAPDLLQHLLGTDPLLDLRYLLVVGPDHYLNGNSLYGRTADEGQVQAGQRLQAAVRVRADLLDLRHPRPPHTLLRLRGLDGRPVEQHRHEGVHGPRLPALRAHHLRLPAADLHRPRGRQHRPGAGLLLDREKDVHPVPADGEEDDRALPDLPAMHGPDGPPQPAGQQLREPQRDQQLHPVQRLPLHRYGHHAVPVACALRHSAVGQRAEGAAGQPVGGAAAGDPDASQLDVRAGQLPVQHLPALQGHHQDQLPLQGDGQQQLRLFRVRQHVAQRCQRLRALIVHYFLMKFQPEQKGLFTFYREQHLFQQEILAKRTHLQASAREPIKEKRKKKEAPDQPSQQPEKVISQPTPIQEDLSETKRPDNFLRYGEAVAIFKRKTAEQINPLLSPKNKQQSLPKEELGTYLQNKNMSFERPEKKEGAQVLQAPPRKKGHSKRMEKMRSSYSKPIIQGRSSTKLPSLVKVDQEDTASPPQYRSKVSGSILKANGGELLRHIRSRAVIEESEQEDQRSVSYFEFNRDVRRESGSKRGDLSMEQRKLLQILGRYRRYDH